MLFFGCLHHHGFHNGLVGDETAQIGAVLYLALAVGDGLLGAAVEVFAVYLDAVHGKYGFRHQAA